MVALAIVSDAGAQGTASAPRPGLTAQQTKDAIKLAKGAMTELRKKTEGASLPAADVREYVVGVELLVDKETTPPAADADAPKNDVPAEKEKETQKQKEKATPKAKGPRAVVTSYRYFDDITVFSIIDLGTGRVVDVQAAQHLRTPLSDEEFADAQALAREKSEEVKQLYERFGEEIRVDPQFSQFQRQGRPTDPSGRASDLPCGKAGAELSAPPGRPDDARGRDTRPRAPAQGAPAAAMRLRRSLANPVHSERDAQEGNPHARCRRSARARFSRFWL